MAMAHFCLPFGLNNFDDFKGRMELCDEVITYIACTSFLMMSTYPIFIYEVKPQLVHDLGCIVTWS